MRNTGKHLIGPSPFQLIKPENLKNVFTSPRLRAKQTVELVLEGLNDLAKAKLLTTEEDNLREWEYGDYEGLLTSQIIELRNKRGLDKDLPKGEEWNIWRDGCENGETHEQVSARLDKVITNIRAIHEKAIQDNVPCDVIVVGHGHILRCFAARWVGRDINVNPQVVLDAGGVGVLSYQHHNIHEPALCLAGAFVVPIEEEGSDI